LEAREAVGITEEDVIPGRLIVNAAASGAPTEREGVERGARGGEGDVDSVHDGTISCRFCEEVAFPRRVILSRCGDFGMSDNQTRRIAAAAMP